MRHVLFLLLLLSAQLHAQSNIVLSLAVSPDGKWAAASLFESDEPRLRLWNIGDGKPQGSYEVEAVSALQFGQNGKRILGAEQKLWVWDVVSRRLVSSSPLGADAQSSATERSKLSIKNSTFSSDGKWLATYHNNNVCKVWSVAKNKTVHEIDVGFGGKLDLSSDGQALAIGGALGTAIYDLARGKKSEHKLKSSAVVLGPDGKWAAAEIGREVSVMRGGDVLHRLGKADATTLVFDPQGKRLAVLEGEGQITVWELSSGNPLYKTQLETPDPYFGSKAVFTPDGTTLITSSGGQVVVWDATSGKKKRVLLGK